jgi:hypothetical protein
MCLFYPRATRASQIYFNDKLVHSIFLHLLPYGAICSHFDYD